jgi:antirestriction protein
VGHPRLRQLRSSRPRRVCTIAHGIAEHGTAFACWAVALDRPECATQLARFDDAFIGRFDDYDDFAREFLDSMGFSLSEVDLGIVSGYVTVDYDRLGRDLAYDHRVVPTGEGLFVFEG